MHKKLIIQLYTSFVNAVEKNKLNVTIPKLFNKQNSYTVSGLSIIFFYRFLGKIKNKKELVSFLRQHRCCTDGHPHPRHFGIQYGFHFLVKDSYHPRYKRHLKAGEYCLYSITKCHPNLQKLSQSHRTTTVTLKSFQVLKEAYFKRCAVCGSEEGMPSFKNRAIITRLERGHCNPRAPLNIQNCIPICTYCNHVYRDTYVFNKRGIIVRRAS